MLGHRSRRPLRARSVHRPRRGPRRPLLVLNDEAHHTHDEGANGTGSSAHLDADAPDGAEPRNSTSPPRPAIGKGALFAWTVFDYPLKQAIVDGIVKRPVKGITEGRQGSHRISRSVRYEPYLTAGVERWREYREQP